MSNVEDKKKTKFLLEIHQTRKFLLSLLDSVGQLLEEYGDLIEPTNISVDESNTLDDLKLVEKSMHNIASKIENLRQGIEMNRESLVNKIDENRDWIENPVQRVERHHRDHALRGLLLRRANEQLAALKSLPATRPN